ncbi:hypothetical protein PAL_GLEAN10012839, partial [Pteropus alecto]
DVDECTVVNGGCQQSCINTLGTFHCECDTGYRLHADERTCIKMDPCTGGNGYAHICQSENEVARCACHPGYQLSEDKKACEDDDELEEEEEELEVVRFAGLLFKSTSQLLHYVAAFLPPTHQDEEDEEEDEKDTQELTALQKVDCPKGAYGAGCSSECQCVEENTLECNAKNGSCTCKSGYQGNRCQKGTI